MHGQLNVKIIYFILIVFVFGQQFDTQHQHIAPWDCDINIIDKFWKLLLIRILSYPKF